MTLDEAVEEAVRRTGAETLRALCRDDNPDALLRDSYRKLAFDIASNKAGASREEFPPPPGLEPIPAADAARKIRSINACPDRTKAVDCGCAGMARCARGYGKGGLVNHHDCLARSAAGDCPDGVGA